MEPKPPEPCLEVEPRGDAIIARFTREVILTGQLAEAAADWLMALVPGLGKRRLLVDFGNVRSITSLMLSKLVKLTQAVEAGGGRLALFNLSPFNREIMEITRLHLVLLLYEDEAAALQGP